MSESTDEVYTPDEDEEDLEHKEEFDQQTYEATKSLVLRKSEQLDVLKEELKQLSEALRNIYINDRELSEKEEASKELKKAVTKRKQIIAASPEAQSVNLKIREKREDMLDLEDSLSNQLLSLYQITGVQEFEYEDGEVREYKVKAKLKGKGRANKVTVVENQVNLFTGEVVAQA